MENFMPFFGRNNRDFDKLHQKIGDEAATKIQTWWRNVKVKGKGDNSQVLIIINIITTNIIYYDIDYSDNYYH